MSKINVMATDLMRIPSFDDILFEIRNKEYGAYVIRKKYGRNIIISILIGIIIMATTVITAYLNAKALENRQKHTESQVEIRMENLDQPNEIIAPPPPPPPPPEDVVQSAKYIPPVVVDSVKHEDTVQLMTADEARVEVKNKEVVEIIQAVKEEVQEEVAEPDPFITVEEMPVPHGGNSGLFKYITDNTIYPKAARENNIQGKVVVQFCVTSKGDVEKVSILSGVEPELDAEAIRIVKSLPTFKPGKQSGKSVPVWLFVPIYFKLK